MKKLLLSLIALTLVTGTLSAEPVVPVQDAELQAMPSELAPVLPSEADREETAPATGCQSQVDQLGKTLPEALEFTVDEWSNCTVSLSACMQYFTHYAWKCEGSDCAGQARAYRKCCCSNMGGRGCMSSWESTQLCC